MLIKYLRWRDPTVICQVLVPNGDCVFRNKVCYQLCPVYDISLPPPLQYVAISILWGMWLAGWPAGTWLDLEEKTECLHAAYCWHIAWSHIWPATLVLNPCIGKQTRPCTKHYRYMKLKGHAHRATYFKVKHTWFHTTPNIQKQQSILCR